MVGAGASSFSANTPLDFMPNCIFNTMTGTQGCGFTSTVVTAMTAPICSAYPEFRWPYTATGEPSLDGHIPPTINQASCVAPYSDGFAATFGGQGSDGSITTLSYSAPQFPYSITETYPDINIALAGSQVIFTRSQDYFDPIISKLPTLSVVISYPGGKESGYTNQVGAYPIGSSIVYDTGIVGDTTFFHYKLQTYNNSGGVVIFSKSQTSTFLMQPQFCNVPSNVTSYDCEFSGVCQNGYCTVQLIVAPFNITPGFSVSTQLNIPYTCPQCGPAGENTTNTVDQVGRGCFLVCWNFSGIGGFLGALLEWGIVIFLVVGGVVLLGEFVTIILRLNKITKLS